LYTYAIVEEHVQLSDCIVDGSLRLGTKIDDILPKIVRNLTTYELRESFQGPHWILLSL